MTYSSNLTTDLEYSRANFPTQINNNGSIKTLQQACTWVSENIDELKKELTCTGAVLFRGFPVSNAKEYHSFFQLFNMEFLPMKSPYRTPCASIILNWCLQPMKGQWMLKFSFIMNWHKLQFIPISFLFSVKIPLKNGGIHQFVARIFYSKISLNHNPNSAIS